MPLIPFLICLLLCCIGSLQAQAPSLQNLQMKLDHYDAEWGTTGFLLQAEYRCVQDQRLFNSPISLRLCRGMDTFYQRSEWWLAPVSSEWKPVQWFIPYRQVQLYGGEHELRLELEVQGQKVWEQDLRFRQPNRYEVVLDWRSAAIKKLVRPWDKGHPSGQAPDVYTSISTNQGTKMLAQTAVQPNVFELQGDTLRFFVLENERVYWHFWDEDGEEDQALGKYDLGQVQTDFKDEQKGRMFDQVRSLHYILHSQQIRQQPLTLRLLETGQYRGRTGLWLEADFGFSAGWLGRRVDLRWEVLDLEQQKLGELPLVYALSEQLVMSRRGQWRFFVPHYLWKDNIRFIQLRLVADNGEVLDATPCFVPNRLRFAQQYQAQASLSDTALVQGARGLRLELRAQLGELGAYSPLRLLLRNNLGQDFLPEAYVIQEDGRARRFEASDLNRLQQGQPLSLFISHLDWRGDSLRCRLLVKPDVELELLQEAWAIRPATGLDRQAQLKLISDEDKVFEDDFGKQVNLEWLISPFFVGKARLSVQVFRNGTEHERYNFIPDGFVGDSLWLGAEAQRFSLHFPYRMLSARDKISVRAQLLDGQGRALSPSLDWSGYAPDTINNYRLTLSLNKLKGIKGFVPPPSDSFHYVLKVGKRVIKKERVDYRQLERFKASAEQPFLLHRDDRFSLFFVLGDREVMCWEKGDLLQWYARHKKGKAKMQPLGSPLYKAVWRLKLR